MSSLKTKTAIFPVAFYYLLFFSLLSAQAQQIVTGRITDAENNEPVAGVSVFLSNTTIGTVTDAEGYYQLSIPENGNYRLTISHVGYQSVFEDIEPTKTPVKFDAALTSNEMEEVTVSVKVKFRQKDINLFWRTILGKNPSRRTIQVLNPETVYYYYNAETQMLRVTCREPLQIVNHETGYQIHYVLNHFTHDYENNVTDWGNQFIFTELKPENVKQKNNWEKNRQEVYHVSLTKFLKSLYNNSLHQDGFILAALRQNLSSSNPYQISLLNPESILSEKSADNSKTLKLSNEQLMLICYGSPVTDDDLYMIQNMKGKSFMSDRNLWINLLYGNSIRIFPDGTYDDKLLMAPVNLPNTLLSLNMRLPIEYLPDASTLQAEKNADAFNYETIAQHFDTQIQKYPHEKIHLHTDRDFYVPGEKIWFKIYLTDAATHLYPTNSRYVFVELLNPVDTLVGRVMIRPTDDMYYGNLPLTDFIPEGNYTLCAYTKYMENQGDDYFFKKNIRIGNLSAAKNDTGVQDKDKTGSVGAYRIRPNEQDDFDVSFYPEGGNLLGGVFYKVAFKAINKNGYPERISGKITDDSGTEIASIETIHAGMGAFSFIPNPEKRYFLKCRNGNGTEKQFELPKSELRGYALTASQKNNRLSVGVSKSARNADIPCYLLAHCQGMVFYFAEWKKENEYLVIPEETLPAGVLQFVLFDEKMNPLSERLIFSKNNDAFAKVDFQTDKEVYEKRDKVAATLSFPNSLPFGEGWGGASISIAITDDQDYAVDESTTILSSLLLSSELKGYIENPAYYLQDDVAMDLLMMTHGWRRYNVPEVVVGNYESPQLPFQTSQKISGKLTRGNQSRPVPDSEVFMMVKGGDYGMMTTDANGQFVFDHFEYPDSSSYYLQAADNKGSIIVEIVLDEESFPKPKHAPQSPYTEISVIKEETIDDPDPNAFMVKAEQRAKFDEDIWMIQLSEVDITAPKIERKDETRLQYSLNSSSDAILRRETFEKWQPKLVLEILRRVAGVQVSNNGIIQIGGGNDGLPLVLIDGMPFYWPPDKDPVMPYDSPVEQVNVNDVESIDIFKFGNTALFGSRGSGGVISITTRRGIDVIREVEKMREGKSQNSIYYTPLGYQKPVAFYSPKYETLEAKRSVIPDYRTTIFWKPDVVISEDGEASFEFYTSDYRTTYSVVIEGITDDGRMVRQVEKIKVE